jgi:hypothetical protein
MGKFKKTSYMAALSFLTAVLFLGSPKPVFGKEDNPSKDKKTSSQGKKGSPPGLEDFQLPEQLPDKAREHLPELPPQVPEKLREAFKKAASPST